MKLVHFLISSKMSHIETSELKFNFIVLWNLMQPMFDAITSEEISHVNLQWSQFVIHPDSFRVPL